MTSVTPTITSQRSFPGARVLIVEARYYTEIADALLEGQKRRRLVHRSRWMW